MFFRYLSFFILGTFLVAQEETRPTVAILDFEGQDITVHSGMDEINRGKRWVPVYIFTRSNQTGLSRPARCYC